MTRGPAHRLLTGPLDSTTCLDIVNQLVSGFLDQHLRGIPGDFPDEQLRRFPASLAPHDVTGIHDWWDAKTPDDCDKPASVRRP